MKLKLKVDTLDGIDPKYHELYEKTDDGYRLNADTSEMKGKLDEFRTNNRNMHNEIAELKKQLDALADRKDIDPEEYARGQKALKDLEEAREKEMIDEGKIDEVVEQRVSAMRSAFEKQDNARKAALEAAEKQLAEARTQLSGLTIETQVLSAVEQVGKLRGTARDDVRARAGATWKLTDGGKLQAVDASGEPVFGPKGDPITPAEWATGLIDSAPHLFEGGGGGGGGGGEGGGGGSTRRVSNDPEAIGRNLEAIAKGEAVVSGN